MLPKELTGDLVKRLSTIKGQIEGIIKMIDEDKDPEQILNKFKDANNGLQKNTSLIIRRSMQKKPGLKTC